jgi:AcrR family transcriptional regulator
MDQVMSDVALLKAAARKPSQSNDRGQLSRFDWLGAALKLFLSEGIDAVRITRLSDELGVSRGSFYWHFDDREDLIDALVEFWRSKNTRGITSTVETVTSLVDGILNYFETCIDSTKFDPRLDLTIREWARRSETIRKLVASEDTQCLNALSQFYQRFGYSMPDALIRARVLYFSQIGFYALEVAESLTTRLSYTESYFECFTGEKLSKTDAKRFKKHILFTYGDQLK